MHADSKLKKQLNEMVVAAAQRGSDCTPTTEVRQRLVFAAERYADLAVSVARNLSDAAQRIREAEDFAEPRRATSWCGGFEDLQRLRGEIDALTAALEIAEHFEESAGTAEPR